MPLFPLVVVCPACAPAVFRRNRPPALRATVSALAKVVTATRAKTVVPRVAPNSSTKIKHFTEQKQRGKTGVKYIHCNGVRFLEKEQYCSAHFREQPKRRGPRDRNFRDTDGADKIYDLLF